MVKEKDIKEHIWVDNYHVFSIYLLFVSFLLFSFIVGNGTSLHEGCHLQAFLLPGRFVYSDQLSWFIFSYLCLECDYYQSFSLQLYNLTIRMTSIN